LLLSVGSSPQLQLMLTDLLKRAKDAVAAMIKRLAHRNANVQLYTLEVCAPCERVIITSGV
jgi:hypothetical protein